jgi:hypothetical protein
LLDKWSSQHFSVFKSDLKSAIFHINIGKTYCSPL